MNAAQIVVGEVQAERDPVLVPLFAEGIRQPRKTANLHAYREILAFDVRRANALAIRVADNWDHLALASR